MSSVGLSALYGSQPLVVWVEDEPTRIALTTAWAGDSVAIHIGGGNDTIRAVVNDAWRNGVNHVFGVVDRDHGRSNIAQWPSPPNDLRVYVLHSPEIETLSLDALSLAECAYNTANRTEGEIEARLNQIAATMNWWMACCIVLMTVRERRNHGFPALPSIGRVVNEASALAYMTSADWFSTTASTLPGLTATAWLTSELQKEEARISAAIAAGVWRGEISGKQVFHQITDYVYTKGAGSDKHTALLQAVFQQQVSQGRIPSELSSLRSSLRARVGLP